MIMSQLKITDLKKSLKQLDQNELIQIIADLYKLNSGVKEYLSSKFGGEDVINELHLNARKKIETEFFPERGMPKLRLAEAKQAITDFKKATNDSDKVADLMLFYVEMGTKFTCTYGDIDMKFYNSMISMFDKVAVACEQSEGLYTSFKDRLEHIVSSSDGIGWGYHDALCDIYYCISWSVEEDEE